MSETTAIHEQEDFDCRTFSRAIGTEQAENMPLGHFKRQTIKCREVIETLAQCLGGDCERRMCIGHAYTTLLGEVSDRSNLLSSDHAGLLLI
jgi:hypothetical protein